MNPFIRNKHKIAKEINSRIVNQLKRRRKNFPKIDKIEPEIKDLCYYHENIIFLPLKIND